MKKYFITTAIDYVNSLPHIGTAYEKIGADVLARYHRMIGDDVLFQMGNDEHSVNVKKSAQDKKMSPKDYCDSMRPQFEDIWKKLNISYDRFVQTSDPRHHQSVQKLFQRIYDAGDIYEGEYEGLYCESCEAFYTEKDLDDGKCPQHQKPPAHIKEKNYFFKLSKFEDRLLEIINKNPDFIMPANRRNEIVNVIKGGLKDISVSRSSFDWGIPLPINEKHVVYVWFDALINYITLIGFADNESEFKKWWPADQHIIGKDITRFHCIIWPAMLLSAGLDLPKSVFGHGFVYLKGEKMSKSLGNVVTPLDVIDQYGADSLRYYLMRTASFGDDGNFTWEDFINRYNSDLANGLGNLVSRTAGMIGRYFNGEMKVASLAGDDAALANRFDTFCAQLESLLNPEKSKDILFHRSLENIWQWIGDVDKYIDNQAPWVLAKEKKFDRLGEVLTTVTCCLYHIGILLTPFIPQTIEKMWPVFGFHHVAAFEKMQLKSDWDKMTSIKIEKPQSPLFPRIEVVA